MINDEALRTLMADPVVHPPLSPVAVRRRARHLRRSQRLYRSGAVAVLASAVALGGVNVQASLATPPIVNSPVAYGAGPDDQLSDGRLPLKVAGAYAWADPDGLCWGEFSLEGRLCVPTQLDSTGPINVWWDPQSGLAVAVIRAPVVRAEFYNRTHAVPGEPVSFARYPNWRLVSGHLTPPYGRGPHRVGVRGWDAAGKLVLDFKPWE